MRLLVPKVKPRVSTQSKDAPAFVIVLKFQRFQWGQLVNATTCAGGYLQVISRRLFFFKSALIVLSIAKTKNHIYILKSFGVMNE